MCMLRLVGLPTNGLQENGIPDCVCVLGEVHLPGTMVYVYV
jgi:hypothetical protein